MSGFICLTSQCTYCRKEWNDMVSTDLDLFDYLDKIQCDNCQSQTGSILVKKGSKITDGALTQMGLAGYLKTEIVDYRSYYPTLMQYMLEEFIGE